MSSVRELLLLKGSDFGVVGALFGLQVLGYEFEHGRAGVSVAKNLPVLASISE